MSGSLNKACLIGHLGADPEARSMDNGNPVVSLSIATSESWKDKATGEKRERTEWHRVTIFSEGLCKVAQQFLKKGSQVYIEGKIQTRSYEQDGVKKYSTEIILQGFDAKLTMLGGNSGSRPPPADDPNAYGQGDNYGTRSQPNDTSYDDGSQL